MKQSYLKCVRYQFVFAAMVVAVAGQFVAVSPAVADDEPSGANYRFIGSSDNQWNVQTSNRWTSGGGYDGVPPLTGPGANDNLTLGVNANLSVRLDSASVATVYNAALKNLIVDEGVASLLSTFNNWHTTLVIGNDIDVTAENASLVLWDRNSISRLNVEVKGDVYVGETNVLWLGQSSISGSANNMRLRGFSVDGAMHIDGTVNNFSDANATYDNQRFLGDIHLASTGVLVLNKAMPDGTVFTSTPVDARSLNGSGTVYGAGGGSASVRNSYLTLKTTVDTEGVFSGVLVDSAPDIFPPVANKLHLEITGSGSQRLTGNNTYTGDTRLSGGTLILDYNGGDSDRISSSSALVLAGGTLALDGGSHQQAFNGVTIVSGSSAVTRLSGSSTVDFGAMARQIGGTVDFGDSVALTRRDNGSAGIIGGFATVGGVTWAVSGGDGVNSGAITGLADGSYDQTYSGGVNANFDAASSGTFALSTVHSIRFNTAESVTVGLNGPFSIQSGGILVTSNVGEHDSVIQGGSYLTASEEIIIHQHNTDGILRIATTMASVNLSHNGQGTTELATNNTYSGTTYINSGRLRAGVENAFSNASVIVLRNQSDAVLDLNDFDNTVRALSGGGEFGGTVELGSGTLTLNVSSGSQSFSGKITGSGSVVKSGTGTQTLSGSSDYSGGTTLLAGSLTVTHGSALGSGTVTVGGTSAATLTINGSQFNQFVLSNNIVFSNTNATTRVVYTGTMNTDALSLGTTGQVRSGFDDGINTTVALLGGVTTNARTIEYGFSTGSAALNDDMRFSDIFHFVGTSTDIFVLQLSVDGPLPEGAFLAWLDSESSLWVEATLGNVGEMGSLAETAFLGSWDSLYNGSSPLADYLGSWGYDSANSAVWAVLDHNSDFSIVPEPHVYALGFGILAIALAALRKRFRRS